MPAAADSCVQDKLRQRNDYQTPTDIQPKIIPIVKKRPPPPKLTREQIELLESEQKKAQRK